MRTFAVVQVNTLNKVKLPLQSKTSRYKGNTPAQAAKKVFSHYIRNTRKFKLHIHIHEITKNSSSGKLYSYLVQRTKLKKPIIRFKGQRNEFMIRYSIETKSISPPPLLLKQVGGLTEEDQKQKKQMTLYNSKGKDILIQPDAFENTIIEMTKMKIDPQVRNFFRRLHDVLLKIKITPEFCCSQKGELFDVLQEGIDILDERDHKQKIMDLAEEWRKHKCEENITDWTQFCNKWWLTRIEVEKTQQLNQIEIENIKEKNDLTLQNTQEENSIELRKKVRTRIIDVSSDIGSSLVKAGIASGAVRTALNIIPNYAGYLRDLNMNCEIHTKGWFSSTTTQSDAWICQTKGTGWIANVFASTILQVLNTIGKGTEQITGDISNSIALLIFFAVFVLTIVYPIKWKK